MRLGRWAAELAWGGRSCGADCPSENATTGRAQPASGCGERVAGIDVSAIATIRAAPSGSTGTNPTPRCGFIPALTGSPSRWSRSLAARRRRSPGTCRAPSTSTRSRTSTPTGLTWRWSRRNSDTATTSITLNPATTGTNSSAFLSQGGPLRDDRFARPRATRNRPEGRFRREEDRRGRPPTGGTAGRTCGPSPRGRGSRRRSRGARTASASSRQRRSARARRP